DCVDAIARRLDAIVSPGHTDLGAKSSHVHKCQEKRQCRLCPLVFIDAVSVQTVSAAMGRWIVERRVALVFAKKPIECAPHFASPNFVAGHSPCIQTGRDCGACLNGLLVKLRLCLSTPVEAVRPDRTEESRL